MTRSWTPLLQLETGWLDREIGTARFLSCSCGSGEAAWWARDYQGIEITKVCSHCEKDKLSAYRPEILTGYDQSDVDEPIEPID
jgi:hypothetical protein